MINIVSTATSWASTSPVAGLFDAFYRTELESFTRVLSQPSLQYFGIGQWRAESKDGLYRWYGDTADSSIESVGVNKPRLWAQSRYSRSRWQHHRVQLLRRCIHGSLPAQEILYGGLGVAPSTKISFVYETVNRPDPIHEYRYGTDVANSGAIIEFKRLDRIHVVHIPTGEVVRKYDLTYEAGAGTGGRSRLASMQECSGADCFAPTNFEWRNGTPGWSTRMIVLIATITLPF